MSAYGAGGAGYQPFVLPTAGRKGFSEKIKEEDVDRSGNLGIGLTEKEIDERVSSFINLTPLRQSRIIMTEF